VAGLERLLILRLQPYRNSSPDATATALALWLLEVLLSREPPSSAQPDESSAAWPLPQRLADPASVATLSVVDPPVHNTATSACVTGLAEQSGPSAHVNPKARGTVQSDGSWWDGRTTSCADVCESEYDQTNMEGSELSRGAGKLMSVARLLQEYKVHLPYGVVDQVLRGSNHRDGLRFAARLYGSWTALFELLLPGVPLVVHLSS
jgi:hypothetical protein